jgi:hypothetical protein
MKHYRAQFSLETMSWDTHEWDCNCRYETSEKHINCVTDVYSDATKPYATFDTTEPELMVYAEHHESLEAAKQLVRNKIRELALLFNKAAIESKISEILGIEI